MTPCPEFLRPLEAQLDWCALHAPKNWEGPRPTIVIAHSDMLDYFEKFNPVPITYPHRSHDKYLWGHLLMFEVWIDVDYSYNVVTVNLKQGRHT